MVARCQLEEVKVRRQQKRRASCDLSEWPQPAGAIAWRKSSASIARESISYISCEHSVHIIRAQSIGERLRHVRAAKIRYCTIRFGDFVRMSRVSFINTIPREVGTCALDTCLFTLKLL